MEELGKAEGAFSEKEGFAGGRDQNADIKHGGKRRQKTGSHLISAGKGLCGRPSAGGRYRAGSGLFRGGSAETGELSEIQQKGNPEAGQGDQPSQELAHQLMPYGGCLGIRHRRAGSVRKWLNLYFEICILEKRQMPARRT